MTEIRVRRVPPIEERIEIVLGESLKADRARPYEQAYLLSLDEAKALIENLRRQIALSEQYR